MHAIMLLLLSFQAVALESAEKEEEVKIWQFTNREREMMMRQTISLVAL